MQPVLNFAWTRRSASTISGLSSPDSSGSTSRPRTSAPSARVSAANSSSNAARSISARSNFAQAFSRWLAALVRRMMSAGSPRAVSNRANASNGEVVSTPPKSQITAAMVMSSPLAYAKRHLGRYRPPDNSKVRPSRRPIHHDQARHAGEFAGIGSDESGPGAAGLRRDQHVIGTDGCGGPFQLDADVGGLDGIRRRERQQGYLAAGKKQRDLVLISFASLT